MIEKRKRNIEIYRKKTRKRNPLTYMQLAIEYGLTQDRIYQIVRDVRLKLIEGKIREVEIR